MNTNTNKPLEKELVNDKNDKNKPLEKELVNDVNDKNKPLEKELVNDKNVYFLSIRIGPNFTSKLA